jgi:predicted AlkP superfamily pyrophosphatase or phosphodiesterase
MSTIFLLLDAFRYDYVSKEVTPFLWNCSKEGKYIKRVIPSAGFCERSEIFTGQKPDESGFFTAIGFDPENSPYDDAYLHKLEFIEKLLCFGSKILSSKNKRRVNERFRSYAEQSFRKKGIVMSSYLIPLRWLHHFSLTEDRIDMRKPEAFSKTSIFELLEQKDRSYFYDTFTALNFHSPYNSDTARLDAVVEDIGGDAKDLYLIYISSTDAYGHSLGPGSQEFKNILKELDKNLENFFNRLEKIAPGNRYIFLGDHGMLPVDKQFDAECEINHIISSSGLSKKRDYVFFLDSTMVRFWGLTQKAKKYFSEVLFKSAAFKENGSWINDELAEKYSIPWPDRRYGDYLWIANPGVLVFPDFFHRTNPYKGMHGYDTNLPESQGLCICYGMGIEASNIEKEYLYNIYHIINELLES